MKVDICGIKVDNITMIEAVAAIRSKYGTGERFIVVTPNAEIIEESAKNPEVAEILNSADMAVPDGVGVIYASRILKQPIAERVTGVDLAYNLAEDMSKHGASLFILGGEPGVAELAAVNITKKYPGLKIAGTHDGFYKEESGVIDIINASGADVLYIRPVY